jgi:endonuclease YncB( thermonuclease family)
VGLEVTLKVVDTDRYGRTVAEILRGSLNINLQMVRRSQAFAYRQYLGNRDASAYLGAERGAEVDRLGVWSSPGGSQRRRRTAPLPPRSPMGAAAAVERSAPTSAPRSCCARATPTSTARQR